MKAAKPDVIRIVMMDVRQHLHARLHSKVADLNNVPPQKQTHENFIFIEAHICFLSQVIILPARVMQVVDIALMNLPFPVSQSLQLTAALTFICAVLSLFDGYVSIFCFCTHESRTFCRHPLEFLSICCKMVPLLCCGIELSMDERVLLLQSSVSQD